MDSPPAELEDYLALEDESHCGAIKPDYFALDSTSRLPPPPSPDPDSDSSENPSWVDPDSSSHFADAPPAPALWSDSSSLHSEPGTEEPEENNPDPTSNIGFGSESGLGPESPVPKEGEKRGTAAAAAAVAWWKLPLELVRFCALRMKPVWTVSIAAAIVGVVMLGRKLYKMRHKGRSVPLRVSLDDKKSSLFMARAARLNDAFSIVRRAPIIRPSLPPASGVTPWPVVGLL